MGDFNLESGGLFTIGVIYGGVMLAATWLAMVIWTFRDMRARSRDLLTQIIVAVMVALLTVPGLLIYLFLRPRETLAEAYERSLEEEALLQDIEEKPTCPGCRQRVNDDWQACPHCHTRLKKPCTRCGRTLELSWDLCPYCTTPLTVYTNEPDIATAYAPTPAPTASRAGSRPGRGERRRAAASAQTQFTAAPPTYNGGADANGGSLQFVDNDDGS